jgi:CRISPR/Cas system endoribonuclease Cas6 (RAMP superfamily)
MLLPELGNKRERIELKNNHKVFGNSFKFMLSLDVIELLPCLLESGFGYNPQMGLGMIEVLRSE